MDCSLLNGKVLGAVRMNLGCEEPDDESLDYRIVEMGPMEVFQRYLEWEGIIGYANDIWSSVENIKKAAEPGEDTA